MSLASDPKFMVTPLALHCRLDVQMHMHICDRHQTAGDLTPASATGQHDILSSHISWGEKEDINFPQGLESRTAHWKLFFSLQQADMLLYGGGSNALHWICNGPAVSGQQFAKANMSICLGCP